MYVQYNDWNRVCTQSFLIHWKGREGKEGQRKSWQEVRCPTSLSINQSITFFGQQNLLVLRQLQFHSLQSISMTFKSAVALLSSQPGTKYALLVLVAAAGEGTKYETGWLAGTGSGVWVPAGEGRRRTPGREWGRMPASEVRGRWRACHHLQPPNNPPSDLHRLHNTCLLKYTLVTHYLFPPIASTSWHHWGNITHTLIHTSWRYTQQQQQQYLNSNEAKIIHEHIHTLTMKGLAFRDIIITGCTYYLQLKKNGTKSS